MRASFGHGCAPAFVSYVFTKATRASVVAGVMRSKPVRSGGYDFS